MSACATMLGKCVFALVLLGTLIFSPYVVGQFGTAAQDFGYVTVREGAHMFYWLYYTTAEVESYTERPLVVWLHGGPGASSTGIGNFLMMGPLDGNLLPRNFTWVNDFNVIYLDNPVGTGFSYVDSPEYLTTTNDQIAEDFVNLMRGFYERHPEFEGVPFYIFGNSYGGKMAVNIAVQMREAEEEGSIRSNLRGVGMSNAWISPIDKILKWGDLLRAASLVDDAGYETIQSQAREAERLLNEGLFANATNAWFVTQNAILAATENVDFFDITIKMPASGPDTRTNYYERAREMMQRDHPIAGFLDITYLMNNLVKPALNIPDHVNWVISNNLVFSTLWEEFMKPVTDKVEKLLNETDIILTKYNGNVDLVCSTPGQLIWVDRLRWPGAEGFKNAPRNPIWENGRLEGYYKSYGNFRFFWINNGGHRVPFDNPAGTNAVLRDLTGYPLR